ncbi:hypothetical protein GCM10027612_21070 [Microbispora bryophytorum subsp. camponoti]
MDLDAFRTLLTPAGRGALDEAVKILADGADPVAAASAMRRGHPADLAAAALTQASLRRRAEAKFGPDAAVMYFTPHGLEQATRPEVAAHRAARIRAAGLPADGTRADGTRADGTRADGSPAHGEPEGGPDVLDVCCGIGGDLLALTRAGCRVDAVDLDPLTVEIARANAAALGLSGLAQVRTGDAALTDPGGYGLLFADPARRGRGDGPSTRWPTPPPGRSCSTWWPAPRRPASRWPPASRTSSSRRAPRPSGCRTAAR